MTQSDTSVTWRKTTQNLVQHHLIDPDKAYRLYPTHPTDADAIDSGFEALAAHIKPHPVVLIDGYVGVLWPHLVAHLAPLLGDDVQWVNMAELLLPEAQIDARVAPFLGGDDPIFGKRAALALIDLFDAEALRALQPAASGQTIVYGCGASLLAWDAAYLVYVDIPKNEIQYRSRAGSVWNLGQSAPQAPKPTYKRFYFVDWVLLNQQKAEITPKLDLIVDGQNPEQPTMMRGDVLRHHLEQLATSMFRVRPWFEPGAWGGQWMKANLEGLPQAVPNYAWSFEMIAPEQGVLFASDTDVLEISFDFLMYHNAQHIIGDYARYFGYEFPIRFDFLDTIDGGNLSIQCHPSPAFIREQFGEHFTQDETYYIMECTDDAVVYLGFQDGIEPAAFRAALEDSHTNNTPINITDYVQEHPAKKGDLFLIPHGTIHASGQGSLVLEISATPYIFTFKMYDWLRLDLDGKPRPINIERAFENLDFERQGAVVTETLIAKPTQTRHGSYDVDQLPTHPEHFYAVDRYELRETVEIATAGSVQVLMVVAGDGVVVTANGVERRYNYAETFIVPAAAGTFHLTNPSDAPVTVVRAFIKPEWFEVAKNQWLSLH